MTIPAKKIEITEGLTGLPLVLAMVENADDVDTASGFAERLLTDFHILAIAIDPDWVRENKTAFLHWLESEMAACSAIRLVAMGRARAADALSELMEYAPNTFKDIMLFDPINCEPRSVQGSLESNRILLCLDAPVSAQRLAELEIFAQNYRTKDARVFLRVPEADGDDHFTYTAAQAFMA